MERTSSIKAYQAPTLWVEFAGKNIPCAVPSVAQTEDILSKAKLVTEFASDLSQEAYDFTFDLFAEILSCNHNFIKYTPEDLKNSNITVRQIVGVLTDWVNFIGELANEKN